MTIRPRMTSDALLHEAGELLDTPTRESISGWPRAVALLTRMALETRLRAYWTAAGLAALGDLDMRTQLNCARIYLGPELAGELSFAWHGLSRATHHRPYELDPTAEELRALVGAVRRVNATVAERAASARASRPADRDRDLTPVGQ